MLERLRPWYAPGKGIVWHARYYLSLALMWLALLVLPGGPYKTELKRRIYGFRDEVIDTVDAYRQSRRI